MRPSSARARNVVWQWMTCGCGGWQAHEQAGSVEQTMHSREAGARRAEQPRLHPDGAAQATECLVLYVLRVLNVC